MKADLGPLEDGGRVAIIGGGPGGMGCALALNRQAAQLGRNIQITVLEGKQFSGELHYNQCAGVLSPPLPELLETRLEVPFPYHLSRAEISGYILHIGDKDLIMDGDQHPSIALRRVQFDAYLMEVAQSRGIDVQQSRAVDLEFYSDRVKVYTENAPVEADVVVGAFGLDEGTGASFARITGYHPPEALSSVVTKFHPGEENMRSFGKYIHAFLPADPGIEFGAITPKGNHLTINIAGKAVNAQMMKSFLGLPEVQSSLPDMSMAGKFDPGDFRYFKGRFPCSRARHYYGDRFVMIGDAAGLVRAFKGKGVTSAILTGIRAADTILHAGISNKAFHEDYRSSNQDILKDLPYGIGIRHLTIFMARHHLFTPIMNAARQDPNLKAALFEAVSAHSPYHQILKRLLLPETVLSIAKAVVHGSGKAGGINER